MLRTEDMSQIADQELLTKGWKLVRITKVDELDDNGNQLVSKSGGEPIVKLTLKIQNEGPELGRSFPDKPSLQKHALFKLKAYYKAIGYEPGAEGHDPQKLVDGECWLFVEPGQYQGNPVLNIKPYSIRSVQEGPGNPDGSSPRRG